MIKLGAKVRDTITNFQGIAVARTEWLHGCIRITIQPPVRKDGTLPDPQSFDEPQVFAVEQRRHGPKPEPTRELTPDRR
jgi:hypothetical protein